MRDNIISLIFLDVDGVLSTDKNKRIQAQACRSTSSFTIQLPRGPILNLKKIVNIVPNTRIILSSNWRLVPKDINETISPARMNLEKQLNYYGMTIHDQTISCYGKDRAKEINEYLKSFFYRNGYYPPYIIIDNEIDRLLPYYKGHIISCNSENGLTQVGANISINLLTKYRKEILREVYK